MTTHSENLVQGITTRRDNMQHFDRHGPLQTENETMVRTSSTTMSRSGNKRSRTSNCSPLSFVSIPESKVMEHPVEVINRATKNSANGDYGKAIEVLTKALKNIKLILAGDAKVIMPAKQDFSKKCERQRCDKNCMDCESKGEDSSPSETQGSSFQYDFYDPSPGTSSFLTIRIPPRAGGDSRTVRIFSHPIIINGDCFGVALDPRICQELSCVAIYNLALFHQLKAISLIQSGGDLAHTIAYLHKALNLYEYSHHIFKNYEIPIRVPALRCMALVSNLGQIHHLMGNHLKAQQCNEYLLSVLMYTIDRRKGEDCFSDRNPTSDHQMDGFLTIVQHLIISEENTAPAA